MKTSKTYRLNEHTLYQIRRICERDKCSATEAIEKAIKIVRTIQMIVDNEELQEERYYTMLQALLEEG